MGGFPRIHAKQETRKEWQTSLPPQKKLGVHAVFEVGSGGYIAELDTQRGLETERPQESTACFLSRSPHCLSHKSNQNDSSLPQPSQQQQEKKTADNNNRNMLDALSYLRPFFEDDLRTDNRPVAGTFQLPGIDGKFDVYAPVFEPWKQQGLVSDVCSLSREVNDHSGLSCQRRSFSPSLSLSLPFFLFSLALHCVAAKAD